MDQKLGVNVIKDAQMIDFPLDRIYIRLENKTKWRNYIFTYYSIERIDAPFFIR